MAFLSGSVSFSRFEVVGGSPKRLDEQLLDKLRSKVIGKQRVQRPDHVEIGWVGGRHLLDRQFDVEKNILLECLHFGFRIDSASPPADLMRAYVEMELESLLKEGGNAVINIKSNYKNNTTESDTTFKCGAGNIMAGVALIGTVVRLEE